MASGPITSRQMNGETMETVTDFIILGSKITAGGDYSLDIKRRLLLKRKAMTNLLNHFRRVRLCATPQTEAHQSPSSLGFSRQQHWSGLPFPSPMHESEKWRGSRDYSPPGSSVHGIFQARVLEWGAIAFSNDQPRQHIKKKRHYFADKSPSSQSYGFSSSHVWMWELDYKGKLTSEELMLLNSVVGEDSWESLGLQGHQISQSSRKSVLNIHWKDWCWSWNANILVNWYEELTHWKGPWCWERLKVGREGDGRGWDGWMASPTGWTWVWSSSRSWWWTGRPGVLQSMGSQRIRHDWATELNWTERQS